MAVMKHYFYAMLLQYGTKPLELVPLGAKAPQVSILKNLFLRLSGQSVCIFHVSFLLPLTLSRCSEAGASKQVDCNKDLKAIEAGV